VDPSAVVPADYRISFVALKDGRVLNGLIAGKTDRTLTLRSATEELTIEIREIEKVEQSSLSLMPEGLLETLGAESARDLLAYLMHQAQVPLPVTAASAH
jgi:putative heme-binding domain-containing protein